jgi:hypothetical protein
MSAIQRRVLAALLFVGAAAFVALMAAAMPRYPGGTWWDGARVGHSFWTNFFCDLTQPTRLDGRGPNPAAPLARAAMLALSVSARDHRRCWRARACRAHRCRAPSGSSRLRQVR